MSSPVLTMADLTKRWQCGRPTVYAALKSGELIGFRLGTRSWRFRLEEVEKFERARAA